MNINDIQKVKTPCIDEDRAELSIDEVERYFNEIDEMMKDPPNPFLLLNFDETGFGSRPEKGKYKTVYIVKKFQKSHFSVSKLIFTTFLL